MLNFEFLSQISAGTAKMIIIALFGIIIGLVWLVRRDFILQGVDRPRGWHNLRLWATVVVLLLASIYLYF